MVTFSHVSSCILSFRRRRHFPMDIPPPRTPPNDDARAPTADSLITGDPNSPADILPVSKAMPIAGKSTLTKKKKKKKPYIDLFDNPQPSTSSLSSCCTSSSSSHPILRGLRVSNSRRNPRVLISSVRQKENDVDALALPLGMSIAAFVAQVLERKDAGEEMMSVDHLSKICTLAVAESLDNVFGNKFDGFVKNFEKSFQSTLMTLRLINESSQNNGKQRKRLNHVRSSDLTPPVLHNGEGGSIGGSNIADFQSEAILNTISTEEQSLEETHENVQTDLSYRELALHDTQLNQQLSHVSPNTLHLGHFGNNQSVLSTMQKSVVEQARSNDLKTFEIGLLMKKMQLKESQLALYYDSNFLERFKLSMGISKASFKAKKFKTELEDTRHAELLKTCVDCLVAGLLVMLACVAYGTYVYSHQRITEATASCIPSSKDSNSWWMPKQMASFNSGLLILRCQAQVISRMLFGVLMIGAIAYLLLQRSSSSKQTMPVTFIVLLLGVACGFAGKLCIDTLGASGYHWLFYWEVLCLLHFFSNVCTSVLFRILYGPITVTEQRSKGSIFPYWFRRFLYYAIALLFLPMLCGFIPFAGFGEWNEHFSLLLTELLLPANLE